MNAINDGSIQKKRYTETSKQPESKDSVLPSLSEQNDNLDINKSWPQGLLYKNNVFMWENSDGGGKIIEIGKVDTATAIRIAERFNNNSSNNSTHKNAQLILGTKKGASKIVKISIIFCVILILSSAIFFIFIKNDRNNLTAGQDAISNTYSTATDKNLKSGKPENVNNNADQARQDTVVYFDDAAINKCLLASINNKNFIVNAPLIKANNPISFKQTQGADLLIDDSSALLTEDARNAPSPNVIDAIKAATVYIIVATAKGDEASGTGFLILNADSYGLIATNRHVIEDNQRIICVFHSGTSKQFLSVSASVIFVSDDYDLAIIKVIAGNMKLPQAISISENVKVTETFPVLFCGFPFGSVLALENTYPSATFSKANISSFRRNEHNEISFVQIDGDMNPGNSGGPVVTSSGRLVGVSVSGLLGTNICFIIPSTHLHRVCQSSITNIKIEITKSMSPLSDISVKYNISDPLENIGDIFAVLVHKDIDLNIPPKTHKKLDRSDPIFIKMRAFDGQCNTQGIFPNPSNIPLDRFYYQIVYFNTSTQSYVYSGISQIDDNNKKKTIINPPIKIRRR